MGRGVADNDVTDDAIDSLPLLAVALELLRAAEPRTQLRALWRYIRSARHSTLETRLINTQGECRNRKIGDVTALQTMSAMMFGAFLSHLLGFRRTCAERSERSKLGML